jgi:hypothetical protein
VVVLNLSGMKHWLLDALLCVVMFILNSLSLCVQFELQERRVKVNMLVKDYSTLYAEKVVGSSGKV